VNENGKETVYAPNNQDALRKVFLFLKSRSRTLQLHGADDGILKVAEHKVIFP
jgi:hypothetical protein